MPTLHFLRFKPALFIAAFVLVAGFCHDSAIAQNAEAASKTKLDKLVILSKDKRHRFSVEIADTPKEQRKGLMHRNHLEQDRGMLFVFDNRKMRAFWMKNTHIPLDMLFIGKSGRIRHIHHNAKPNNRRRISSQVPVRAVLEINGGLARKYGIDKGDTVHHSVFGNALAQ